MNNTSLSSSFAKIIEQRLPKDFLPDHTIDEKVLLIIDAWPGMKDKINEQQEQIVVIMKDLEYALNLLNIAETHTENVELKKIINDMLNFYRERFPSKQNKQG
jgi:hypothetical protein